MRSRNAVSERAAGGSGSCILQPKQVESVLSARKSFEQDISRSLGRKSIVAHWRHWEGSIPPLSTWKGGLTHPYSRPRGVTM